MAASDNIARRSSGARNTGRRFGQFAAFDLRDLDPELDARGTKAGRFGMVPGTLSSGGGRLVQWYNRFPSHRRLAKDLFREEAQDVGA